MSNYVIVSTGTTVTGIQLNSTFVNGSVVEINGTTYNTIGNGTNPLNITGDNSGYNFKVSITNLTQSFTLSANCFVDLNIQQFTYPTPQTQTFTIGNSAFAGSKLTSFTIPNVTSIGNDVFSGCASLVNFGFGAITTIPQGLLKSCVLLNNIVIPSVVTSIGDSAFKSSVIQTFSIQSPSQLTTIGPNAFRQSTIPSVTIPDTVTLIDDYAFGESMIPKITVSSSSQLTTINQYAFYNTIIREFNFPATLTTIGDSAFTVSRLSSVNLPLFTNYCTIGDMAFDSLQQVQTVVINGKIKTATTNDALGAGIFSNSQSLKTVQLYDGITSIGDTCFGNCTNLWDVKLTGTTPLTVGQSAFSACGFEYIQIPSNVSQFGSLAFGNCGKLKQVVIEAVNPTFAADTFYQCALLTEMIFTKNFTDFANTDTLTVPNDSFRFYVFTPVQKNSILKYSKYTGKVLQFPYYNRNFIGTKAIYDDEEDPGYVMYTLPSSGNTFNDCTFYFKNGSSPNPVVVIKQSDDGVMTNCVKVYSVLDQGEKIVEKIYKDSDDEWKILLQNGVIKSPQDLNTTYQLQNNFECSVLYDGSVALVFDCSSLSQCDAFDLSNLTKNGFVSLENMDRLAITNTRNNKNDSYTINLISTSGSQILEVKDINCSSFIVSGSGIATLYLEGTIMQRSYSWIIQAPKIIVNQLNIDYTIFQNQQGNTVLTSIQCLNDTYLIKFTANDIIEFYSIQNKNGAMFDSTSTEINAQYYVSGWSMV